MVGREVRLSVGRVRVVVVVVVVVVELGSVGGVAGLVASMFVRDMTGYNSIKCIRECKEEWYIRGDVVI